MPFHTHEVQGSSAAATSVDPGGNLWANGYQPAYTPTQDSTLNPAAIMTAGGGQPHQNMPPYLMLNFCIALQGLWPSEA